MPNNATSGATGAGQQRRRKRRYNKALKTSQSATTGRNAAQNMFGTGNLQQQEHYAAILGIAVGSACWAFTQNAT